MITISINDLSLVVCLITLLIVIYTLFVARRTEERLEAQIRALQNAPILRQYVERFVPIDDSDKAREITAKARREAAEEFESMYNLGDLDGAKPKKFNKSNPIFTKGLNGQAVAIEPEDTV